MNTKQLIAAVAMFAATGVAFAAGNAEYVDFSGAQSVKTRAEVRAELEQAYADGWRVGGAQEWVDFAGSSADATRYADRKIESPKKARAELKDVSARYSSPATEWVEFNR